MYRVIFSTEVHKTIHNFIDSYKYSFLKLFTDTWIYYENQIKQSYIEWSKKFHTDIYYSLENNLREEIIWKKTLDNWYSSVALVWNYRLFINFEEDKIEKTRFINYIEFHKK